MCFSLNWHCLFDWQHCPTFKMNLEFTEVKITCNNKIIFLANLLARCIIYIHTYVRVYKHAVQSPTSQPEIQISE